MYTFNPYSVYEQGTLGGKLEIMKLKLNEREDVRQGREIVKVNIYYTLSTQVDFSKAILLIRGI